MASWGLGCGSAANPGDGGALMDAALDGAAGDASVDAAPDAAPPGPGLTFTNAELLGDFSPRWGHLVADLGDGRAVIFGGTDANAFGGVTLRDTWLVDTRGGQVETTRIATTGPGPRYCGCATYDAARDRVIVTGGRDLSGPFSVSAETWELPLATGVWERIAVPSTPTSTLGCMLAYSASADATFVFGGISPSGPIRSFYRYDPSVPEWVYLDATGPGPRYDGALVPLDGGQRLLLYGGSTSAGGIGAVFYQDLWIFDVAAGTWAEQAVVGESPPGRRVPWSVLSPDGRTLTVVMGLDPEMLPMGDGWELDLDLLQWQPLELPAEIPPRAFVAGIRAAGGHLGLMLSGYDGARPIPEARWIDPR
ncbi:MAG: hypothetical protein OEY14_17580 [Myxococcales bacterium]|nr:hypothetical protein [Myxococcales bacterium]